MFWVVRQSSSALLAPLALHLVTAQLMLRKHTRPVGLYAASIHGCAVT